MGRYFYNPLYPNLHGTLTTDEEGNRLIQWRDKRGDIQFTGTFLELAKAHIEEAEEHGVDWVKDPNLRAGIHEMLRCAEESEKSTPDKDVDDLLSPLSRRL